MLLVGLYLKIYRVKMSDKESDSILNGSYLHLLYRSFTDVLIYSHLPNIKSNHSIIKNIIMDRFDVYKNNGFFSDMDKNINDFRLSEINRNDIGAYVENMFNGMEKRTDEYITDLHMKFVDGKNLLLDVKNQLNDQQINEFIRCEVIINIGGNIDLSKENPEIAKLLTTNSHSNELTNNLSRFISENINIENKNEILKYSNTLGINNFLPSDINLSPDDIEDQLLTSIYIWNSLTHKEEEYEQFINRIQNNFMNRDMMLIKLKHARSSSSDNNNWNYMVN